LCAVESKHPFKTLSVVLMDNASYVKQTISDDTKSARKGRMGHMFIRFRGGENERVGVVCSNFVGPILNTSAQQQYTLNKIHFNLIFTVSQYRPRRWFTTRIDYSKSILHKNKNHKPSYGVNSGATY